MWNLGEHIFAAHILTGDLKSNELHHVQQQTCMEVLADGSHDCSFRVYWQRYFLVIGGAALVQYGSAHKHTGCKEAPGPPSLYIFTSGVARYIASQLHPETLSLKL